MSAYLRSLLGLDHGLVANIQKAWPVVCGRNGGIVDLHSHRNAQLSAVFYVLTDPANESGELEFEVPDDYFSHVMAIPYCDAAVSGGVFAPSLHCLLMFTSGLRHRVLPMRTPHPMDWVPLGS